MTKNNIISIADVLRFFLSKKLIIVLCVVVTLFFTFLYDALEFGNYQNKARIKISFTNQSNNLATNLFLFNYTVKRMIYASDVVSIIQSSEGFEQFFDLVPTGLYDDVMENLNVNTKFMMQTLRKFDFSAYNSEIDGYAAEEDDFQLIFHLFSDSAEILKNSKQGIYNEFKALINNDLKRIFNQATQINKELKSVYVTRIKQLRNITTKQESVNYESSYFKLIKHIERELDIAKQLDIKNSIRTNDQSYIFVKPVEGVDNIGEKDNFVEEIPYYFGFNHKDGYQTLEIIKDYVLSINIEKDLESLDSKEIKKFSEIDEYIKAIDNLNTDKYMKVLDDTLMSMDFNYNFTIIKQKSDYRYIIYMVGFLSGLFIAFVVVFSMFILKHEK